MMMKLIFLVETRQLYNLLLRGFLYLFLLGNFYSVDDSLRLILYFYIIFIFLGNFKETLSITFNCENCANFESDLNTSSNWVPKSRYALSSLLCYRQELSRKSRARIRINVEKHAHRMTNEIWLSTVIAEHERRRPEKREYCSAQHMRMNVSFVSFVSIKLKLYVEKNI